MDVKIRMSCFYNDKSKILRSGRVWQMPISIVAPCGLICDLCIGFQREKNKCSGCTAKGSQPAHCKKCSIVNCLEKNGDSTQPCSTCLKYPCKRLKNLDKRYSSNYGESLIDNFQQIEAKGLDLFLIDSEKSWTCLECGNLLTAHRPQCLHCKALNSHYNRKPKCRGGEI